MYKLLIAEDMEITRNMLANEINWQSINARVSGVAESGIRALELMEKDTPDLLLSDIRMPLMDGFRLIMKVNELYPAVKIVILTAFSDFNYARNAIKLGVVDYVLKPIDEEELLKAIKKAADLVEKNKEQKRKDEFVRKVIKDKLPGVKNTENIINNNANMRNVKFVEQAVEYIRNNVCKDISLADVAESVHLNSKYLNNIFKQTTGESMHKFITSCKMGKAAELLNDPSVKVYEVSDLLGYLDQKYFSSIFTKHYGMNPTEYRNRLG